MPPLPLLVEGEADDGNGDSSGCRSRLARVVDGVWTPIIGDVMVIRLMNN